MEELKFTELQPKDYAPDDDDRGFEDYDEDEDECGLDEDGTCILAGSAYCEWHCPNN